MPQTESDQGMYSKPVVSKEVACCKDLADSERILACSYRMAPHILSAPLVKSFQFETLDLSPKKTRGAVAL